MKEIDVLWSEFLARPFPEMCAGLLIEGIALAELDTYTAGCIDTFIGNDGRLDAQRTSILEACAKELETVVPRLDGEAKSYFEHLRTITGKVLTFIS